MRCETTSSVKECALRARSTHGVHHAIVEVNIVIGVVLGEVLVALVCPLVVDAVIGLALSLIAHVCCCCRFRRSHIAKNFLYLEVYSLHLPRTRRQNRANQRERRHSSRDTPTHAPHPTRHQHQWKLTATRVDLTQILSKSCAIRTISAQAGFSVHPGQATNSMFFLLRWRFDALSAIRFRPPSSYECPSIPKMFAGRVSVGTHDMHDVQCV